MFRVCCVQLCIAVCVFCVQCSVCWIPICSAPPTASTHRAGSVWQEGADLNTMPPGYPPPTPPVQTAPDQDLNALLTPTPSTMVSYSCLGCSNALLRIAQNAKLKEYIVIIKGVANSDLLSKSFPNFTRIFFVLLFLKSFFALFVFVMLVVLYIFRNILCGFTNRPCAIHTYLQDCLRTERSRRSDKIFGAGEVWLRNHRLIKHISHTHTYTYNTTSDKSDKICTDNQ